MSSFKLVRSRGEPFPKFSEFERDIDLLAIAQTSVQDGQDAAFELLLTIPAGANGTTHPLFQLPASIRRRIYGFCFPYEPRKVTLSPPFATKAVFPVEYFASPWDILDSTAGGLQSFSRLRNDLMAYFWSEYHFYVTVTEFSGPKFSPLSHVWLLRYLGTVQRITIEVDFTKFGCSQMKDAKKFGYDMSKTRQLLNAIVCGLGQRPASATVAELHLMCRRYAGFRPLDDTWVESSKDRFCPIDILNLCDSLIHLRGILRQCRVSGFPDVYSRELLNSIFRCGILAPEFTIPEEDPWPSAYPPTLILSEPAYSEPPTPASVVSTDFVQLRLQHSRSFVEEMEDKMSWCSISPKSSNYALSPRFDTHTPGKVEDDGSKIPLAEHVQAYQSLLPEMVISEPSPVDALKTPQPSPGSMVLVSPSDPELVQPTLTVATLRPRTPASKSRIPRAFTPSPRTPNKMNALNEQDPAFIRTVNAMRSLEGANATRHTMIASPKTPESAGSGAAGNRTPMTKRKYMSFVNRLRKCVDG